MKAKKRSAIALVGDQMKQELSLSEMVASSYQNHQRIFLPCSLARRAVLLVDLQPLTAVVTEVRPNPVYAELCTAVHLQTE